MVLDAAQKNLTRNYRTQGGVNVRLHISASWLVLHVLHVLRYCYHSSANEEVEKRSKNKKRLGDGPVVLVGGSPGKAPMPQKQVPRLLGTNSTTMGDLGYILQGGCR